MESRVGGEKDVVEEGWRLKRKGGGEDEDG